MPKNKSFTFQLLTHSCFASVLISIHKKSYLKSLSAENKLLNFRHIGQNTNNLVEFLEKHENILIEAGKDEEPEIET